MNKKQLLILISALVVFTLLFVLKKGGQSADRKSVLKVGEKIFTSFKEDNLTSLKFEDRLGTSELKPEGESWVLSNVQDFPVDPYIIDEFVQRMKLLKIAQVIPGGENSLVSFDLDPKTGKKPLEVEIKKKDGSTQQFYVGKKFMTAGQVKGRYLYFPKENTVAIVAQNLGNVSGSPSLWLKKVLPHNKEVAAVSLFRKQDVLWQISRPNLAKPFQVTYPIAKKSLAQEQVKLYMEMAFAMRYLNITPSYEQFDYQSSLLGVKLVFTTWDNTLYRLEMLGLSKDKKNIRCRISVSQAGNTKDDLGFESEEYQNIIEEWHFLIRGELFEQLISLAK